MRRTVSVLALSASMVSALGGCSMFFGVRQHEELLASGVQAQAVVTDLRETGTRINNNPVCTITLRVTPKEGPEYLAQVREVVSMTKLLKLIPGSSVVVRYDPSAREKVIIESYGAGVQSATVGPEQAQRMTTDSQALLEALNREGAGTTPAVAIVQRLESTGVRVNGDNLLAVVSAKVLPEGEAPFDVQIVGVFQEAGLDKYGPGKEIYVRFDPANRQRVSFDLQKTLNKRSE